MQAFELERLADLEGDRLRLRLLRHGHRIAPFDPVRIELQLALPRLAVIEHRLRAIADHDELLGPDVTMAHLLLKNTVVDAVGTSAYALLTRTAAEHLDVPLQGSVAHTERYAHYEPIESFVFSL